MGISFKYTTVAIFLTLLMLMAIISKHDFFLRFFSDPEFIESYKKRWNEMKSETVDMENFMDQMKQKLELSHRANATTWNLSVDLNEEIEKMKQWWKARISFLDGEINKL